MFSIPNNYMFIADIGSSLTIKKGGPFRPPGLGSYQ